MIIFFIALIALVPIESKGEAVDAYLGSHVCHFTQPAYSDEEIASVRDYLRCQNRKIEESKIDFSPFLNCAPLPSGANLKDQGRYNRARLCADPEYYKQEDCRRESKADAAFGSMVDDCKKRREVETKASQQAMRKRTDNDAFCMKSFEKGYFLSHKESCRNRTMLPPPPSAP